MITLSSLSNTHRPKKKVQRVGRGLGSKRGKTCCRGVKGDKARKGYKTRGAHEGGQLPLYRKLPTKGFPHARFRKDVYSVNLETLHRVFDEGDKVNLASLADRGLLPKGKTPKILKILSRGDLTKKLSIEAHLFSKATVEKLKQSKVPFQKLTISSRNGDVSNT